MSNHNARADADRAVIIAALKALKERIGHDPNRHTTDAEFHAAVARDTRADHTFVWRWQNDIHLTEQERVRRWLMTLLIPGWPYHDHTLIPGGTLTAEQSARLHDLRADYRAGRLTPPWLTRGA